MLRWSVAGLSCFLTIFIVGGCGKKDSTSGSTTDIQETAQQIGDVMASVDEAGGTSGNFAVVDLKAADRLFARVLPEESLVDQLLSRSTAAATLVVPQAEAAACGLSTFGSCSSSTIRRTFGGCTIGSATLTGHVDLTWSGGTCLLNADNQTLTRVPDFTITGRRGGTMTVRRQDINTGVGQRFTRTSGTVFSFTNDGIRRVITYQSSTLFDFTTETTAALTITGATRNGRTLTSTGGGLKVTNNVTGTNCTYTPTNVTWSSTCTCATSGSWSATCSDGKSSSLTITGCGTGDFTMGSETESLYFDRCYSL